MHVPDGYLSLPVATVSFILSAGFLFLASRRVRRGKLLTNESLPTLTALSAGIFVAQMIAWPIPGGTSLHLVGGALAGIVLGPWLGMLSMSLVLLIQCLVFQDGGITSLGANVLTMGITSVLVGYATFRILRGKHFVAGAVAGWLSLTVAGFVCGTLLAVSWGSTLPIYVMTSWHALLGVVEGLITGSVIAYLSVKAGTILRW